MGAPLGLPHGSFTVFVEIHLVFGIGYLQSHVLGVGGGDEQGWSKTQSLTPVQCRPHLPLSTPPPAGHRTSHPAASTRHLLSAGTVLY